MSKGKTRRVRRTAAQWEGLLAEQARSGLTPAAFCRSRGVGYGAFCYWRARVGKGKSKAAGRTAMTPAAGFVELPPWPLASDASTSGGHYAVELELGSGWVLRIGRH